MFNENGSASWRLTLYYGFPERMRRKDAWDMIFRLSKISSLPNDLLYSSDKKGNHPHPGFFMEGFRKELEESMLT